MQRLAATGASQARDGIRAWWPWAAYAAFAAAGCLLAFAGLSTSGYWTDELFTLFVIGHHGGLSEVLRRALTDTHPPAYYFLLYAWSQIAGLSEPALRLVSAACAVGAAAIFYFGLNGVFTRTARAFALAISLNAAFWFFQSQNVRSYALCMLVSAALLVLALAARRQVRAGRSFPVWPCAGLMLAGLAGSFAHSYVFLEVGLVYLFVVATVPSLPLRAVLVAWGAGIAGLDVVFVRALLHSTLQDVHHMWFKADALFFFNQITVCYRVVFGVLGAVAFVVLAISAWRRRGSAAPADGMADEDRRWVAGLAAFGHFGMIGLGMIISVALAPSMSSINLASASPLLWVLMAFVYDFGAPRGTAWPSRVFGGLLVLAATLHTSVLIGRFIVRTEDWRGSARYIAGLQACAGKPIPIVLPQKFGPDTAFFRTLAVQDFYGRYFPDPSRLKVYPAAALTGEKPEAELSALMAARASGADPCPVLAWGVHDLEPEQADALRDGIARAPAVGHAPVVMKRFEHYTHEEVGYSRWPGAFVYLADRPAAATPPRAHP